MWCAECDESGTGPGSVRPFRSRAGRWGSGEPGSSRSVPVSRPGPGAVSRAGRAQWGSRCLETTSQVMNTRRDSHTVSTQTRPSDTNKRNLAILILSWDNLSSKPYEVLDCQRVLSTAVCPPVSMCVSGVSCLVSVSCVCVSGLHRPELGAPHQVLVLTVCLWVPGEGGQGAGEERSCSELSECKYRNVQCVVQPASGPGPVISPVFVSSELVVTSTSLCLSPACVVTAEGGENVSLKCSNYAKFDQSLTESPRDIVTSPRSQHTLHTELITLRILPRSLITNLAIFVWSASVAVQAE